MKKIITIFLTAVIFFNLFAISSSANVAKEKDAGARLKYQSDKQKYLKEVDAYKTARQQVINIREKYRKFQNVENKSAYEEAAKTFLEKAIDTLVSKLEALKNRVANRSGISETERTNMLAELDQDINWLEEKKSGIADASSEQIKETAREMRQYWTNHRVRVKKVIAQIWGARIDFMIEKFENSSAELEEKIAELKANGKDTSQIEVWLNDFKQKINTAKAKREQAKLKYQAISSAADANQLFKEAHQFVKEAHTSLQDAHKDLVKILKKMREMNLKNFATSTEETNKETE